MSKYQLRFWFEHGGTCIWGMNDKAKQEYGYSIKNNVLPISKDLVKNLNLLEKEYATHLDWDYPPNPSPWTEEHKVDFLNRATLVYKKLRDELGSDFEIVNEVNLCIE